MTTPEPRRRYRSALREQQAGQTRAAVVAAATVLFGEKGWAGTGMRDVARAAGVAVETVYANFKSKTELLTACVDTAVVADIEPVPLAQRPAIAELGRGPRAQRIAKTARLIGDIHQRTAGVLKALREAAASDPELARWRRDGEDRRRADIAHAAGLVAGREVTADECDSLWAVTSSEVHDLLTGLRGWSREQYEQWLNQALDRLLVTRSRSR